MEEGYGRRGDSNGSGNGLVVNVELFVFAPVGSSSKSAHWPWNAEE